MQFDIRRLDIYRKIPKDLTQPTFTGAAVSVCSVLFIVFLIISELTSFLQVNVLSELYVDQPKDTDRIPVRLNISLFRLKCDYVGLDIQDDMGRHEVGFHENTHKVELGEEGCRFEGSFYINRVPGNFHISTHSAGVQPTSPDMTHLIHSLEFGDPITEKHLPGAFKAMTNVDQTRANALASHDYITKVVSTTYQKMDGSVKNTFQYTWAHKDYISFGHGHAIMPAIWFRYDFSPITVKYKEERKPLYHFITTVCAIVGGTFTVAGIIDSIIFTAHEVFRKAELGKLS